MEEEEEGRKQLTVPIEVVIGRHTSKLICLMPLDHRVRVRPSHGYCMVFVIVARGIVDLVDGKMVKGGRWMGCCGN